MWLWVSRLVRAWLIQAGSGWASLLPARGLAGCGFSLRFELRCALCVFVLRPWGKGQQLSRGRASHGQAEVQESKEKQQSLLKLESQSATTSFVSIHWPKQATQPKLREENMS